MILILQGPERGLPGLERGISHTGVACRSQPDVDLLVMRDVRRAIKEVRPKAVVMTPCLDLAACEADEEMAFARNAEAAIHLAAGAREFGAVPVLVSTSEVFGQPGGPWSERDLPEPRSVCAQSQLRGETFLGRAAKNALVVRGGPFLCDGLAHRAGLRQTLGPSPGGDAGPVTPVSAFDVGRAIALLIEAGAQGVFHVAARERPLTRIEAWSRLVPFLESVSPGQEDDDKLEKEHGLVAREASRGREVQQLRAPMPALLGDKLFRTTAFEARAYEESLLEVTHGSLENPGVIESSDACHKGAPLGAEVLNAHRFFSAAQGYGLHVALEPGEKMPKPDGSEGTLALYLLIGKAVFEKGPEPVEERIVRKGQTVTVDTNEAWRLVAVDRTEVIALGFSRSILWGGREA